jgi:hypothetical protein
MIFYSNFLDNLQNNSSRCFLQRLTRPQDAGAPGHSRRKYMTWHTCHLGGHHPSTIRAQHCLTFVNRWVQLCLT